jgi:sporulation protein YlmC with PRC-barrel domain
MSPATSGRVLHAHLHLLDRQIVDKTTGRMIAKVDDVDLDMSGTYPLVSALLTGPQAWGARLPGLLGTFVRSVHRRLHPDADPGPNVVPAGAIVDVTSAVLVHADDALRLQGFGRWVDEQIIRRIPGADRAVE